MLEDFKLKTFLKLAETGSFTLAAKELGVSQPAVSQSINTLEKSIGIQLFTRAKGTVYLTEEGMAFQAYAKNINYWYAAADAMFGSEGKLTSNKAVKIAADPISASYLLPSTLSTIYGAHPLISFSIEPIVRGERYSDSIFEPEKELADVPGNHFGTPEDADVEISVAPSPETMDFEGESRLVGVMDATVVSSKFNRSIAFAAEADMKPFSTIAGIHISNRFAVWKGYEQFLTPDLMSRVAIVSTSVEAIKSMVAGADSLAGIVPAIAVEKELVRGELLQMPVRLPDFSFDIHFNPLPEFADKTICKLLLETLKASLRQKK